MSMVNFNKLTLLLFSLVFSVSAWADTEKADTTLQAFYDSSQLDLRHFDETTITNLKSDPELTYTVDRATISLWDRLWRWLRELLGTLFSETASSDWGNLLIYVLAAALLVYAIMALMKLDAFKIFFSGPNRQTLNYSVIEENIHEMDFDKLLNEATSRNDYRLAIRLYFLQGLKLLSDKQLIHWEPGKTNLDYVNELPASELKKGFNELNFYFEYAWYGNFELTPDLFASVKEKFITWKIKL